MNLAAPVNQLAALETRYPAPMRLIKAIMAWFPKADPDPAWIKQAVLTLSTYPMDVLKAIHQRGQLEFFGFPSIPALAQLANRVAGDLHPKQESTADHPWLQWDRRAQELAREAHKLAGWPNYWPGYSEALTWLTKRAYMTIKANWERKGEADCPKVPSAIDLLAQIDGRFQSNA